MGCNHVVCHHHDLLTKMCASGHLLVLPLQILPTESYIDPSPGVLAKRPKKQQFQVELGDCVVLGQPLETVTSGQVGTGFAVTVPLETEMVGQQVTKSKF